MIKKSTLRHGSMTKRDFTLIELLVVIAIIVMIAAMLLPALTRARAMARATHCLSNQKQLALAMDMYADEQEFYPNHYTATGCWVLWTPEDSTPEQSIAAITGGTLYEYVNDFHIYRCPDERRGKTRSYSMSDHVGPHWNQNWGLGPDYLMPIDVVDTSKTMLTLDEYDSRWFNMNSFMLSSTRWIDIPGRWHFNSLVLSFTDGHVDRWAHRDPRTWAIDGHYAPANGNPDHRRIFNAIIGDSRYYDAW